MNRTDPAIVEQALNDYYGNMNQPLRVIAERYGTSIATLSKWISKRQKKRFNLAELVRQKIKF